MSAIAFDLEIAEVPEIGMQPNPENGLGISVAAGVTDTGAVRVWYGTDGDLVTPRMSAVEVLDMMADLQRYDHIVTWNGAAFDMWVLGVESNLPAAARLMARSTQHIDLMMLFCASRRHRLGLKQAALACGSHKGGGGIESGIDAPGLWMLGDYTSAIQYVTQDAQATMDVYEHLVEHRGFTWVSRKGLPMSYRVPFPPNKWSVADLLAAEWSPAEYWITAPVVKDDFVRW